MEEKRRSFKTFLSLHWHKGRASDEPVVYAQYHHPKGVPYDTPLLCMDEEDILQELDTSSELVRWLLHQLRTYDCTREYIVALIFDRETVLSDVLRCKSEY